MINTEVTKAGTETTISTIRKFSRKVRSSGIVRTVRDKRYFVRGASRIVKKKRALKYIERRKEHHRLWKEGKISDETTRHGHTSRFPASGGQTRAAPGRTAETPATPLIAH